MYDRNGNPIDTTSVIDASTIPIGLTSWKIDRLFGNRTEIPVDTLQHNFQNTNDTGGPTGHYTYLGNLGAPRIAHVFSTAKILNSFSFWIRMTIQLSDQKMSFTPIPNLLFQI